MTTVVIVGFVALCVACAILFVRIIAANEDRDLWRRQCREYRELSGSASNRADYLESLIRELQAKLAAKSRVRRCKACKADIRAKSRHCHQCGAATRRGK